MFARVNQLPLIVCFRTMKQMTLSGRWNKSLLPSSNVVVWWLGRLRPISWLGRLSQYLKSLRRLGHLLTAVSSIW